LTLHHRRRTHSRHDRLCAEELVFEVHSQPVVPISLTVERVTIVICGVVDEYVEGPVSSTSDLMRALVAAVSWRSIRSNRVPVVTASWSDCR
jgi:hypothetical protein